MTYCEKHLKDRTIFILRRKAINSSFIGFGSNILIQENVSASMINRLCKTIYEMVSALPEKLLF